MYYKMSNWNILPLEDAVNIIEKMDYRSIINLSQTSTDFNNFVKNNTIVAEIVNRKLDENLAGKLVYDAEDDLAEISIYLGDDLGRQVYVVNWLLSLSLVDLENIITELEAATGVEGRIDLDGDSWLYYDHTGYLAYNRDLFMVSLNKDLFVRLLKEYEDFLITGERGTVRIRNDRSIDKILL